MKAIVLKTYFTDPLRAVKSLKIEERTTPTLKENQVLIRVKASICNPSDLAFIRGVYGIKKETPVVPGFEATGEVVETGSADAAKSLEGQRVAFAANDALDGTWAEFAVADAGACMPVSEHIPDEQAAGMIINPFTAYALIEHAQNNGSKAIVIDAAASQLAGMMRAIAKQKTMRTINIVREDSQVQQLLFEDADYALNMRDNDFYSKLYETVRKDDTYTALDAVGGGLTGVLVNAMPPSSQVIVYGSLSENSINNVDPRDLIYHEKVIRGFSLGKWFRSKTQEEIADILQFIQEMMVKGEIKYKIHKKVPLERVHPALHDYIANMSDGKIVFMPELRE